MAVPKRAARWMAVSGERSVSEVDPETGLRPDILVVDDNPANLAAIEAALGPFGSRLCMVSSGREALRRLLDDEFALILLDVQMPDLDGFATARLIRQRQRTRLTPIIFVTAYDRNDDQVLEGYELGAVDFLFKPIVPEILRAKASVFVELAERTEEVQRQAEQLRVLEQRAAERRLIEERQRWESELLRLQMEEQRRINRQLEEADRRKDEFLALLGHELRNPLAPILNALEIVRALGIEDPKLVWATGIMHRQVGHLRRMVDDLLDVSRITSGKLELRPETITLESIVEQAIDVSRSVIEEREHALRVECGSPGALVLGDPVRLTQVVANLLHNAARYTEPGGEIAVEAGVEAARAWLRVSDNGRGIAPHLLDSIFEMFVQEREGGRGLGLGLALVRQLVEMHGGRVEAHSDGPGLGSTFSIHLPVHLSPERALQGHAAAVVVPGTEPEELGPLHVAIVEDDPDIRHTLRELLEAWGHRVVVAPDGVEGVEAICACRPSLALIDVGLPRLDGYGVARAVRARLADTLHLVAMTGFGRKRDRDDAYQAGFDAHLVKPLSVETLREALRTAAARRTRVPEPSSA